MTDIEWPEVEEVFVLQYENIVYVLRPTKKISTEEMEQKPEIAVKTELSEEEIKNNIKIAQSFSGFLMYNEGCNTCLFFSKF